MKEENFNLSKKIKSNIEQKGICKIPDWIEIKDVREFIKRFKEEIRNPNNPLTCNEDVDNIIDKLAGDRLI